MANNWKRLKKRLAKIAREAHHFVDEAILGYVFQFFVFGEYISTEFCRFSSGGKGDGRKEGRRE